MAETPVVTVTLEVAVEVAHRYYTDYEKYEAPIAAALRSIPGVVGVEWGGRKLPMQ